MPVNRQSVPRAEREAEILDAAQAEFEVVGFDDAKVGAIARRAGMTAANVHYYFSTKEALVTAVASRAYEHLFARLAELADPVERLHRYVRFHLENHALRGQLQAIAIRCPELAEVMGVREAWVAATAAEVTGSPGTLDADALTATVLGLIEVGRPHPDPRAVLDHAVARLGPRPDRRNR